MSVAALANIPHITVNQPNAKRLRISAPFGFELAIRQIETREGPFWLFDEGSTVEHISHFNLRYQINQALNPRKLK